MPTVDGKTAVTIDGKTPASINGVAFATPGTPTLTNFESGLDGWTVTLVAGGDELNANSSAGLVTSQSHSSSHSIECAHGYAYWSEDEFYYLDYTNIEKTGLSLASGNVSFWYKSGTAGIALHIDGEPVTITITADNTWRELVVDITSYLPASSVKIDVGFSSDAAEDDGGGGIITLAYIDDITIPLAT